MKYIVNVPHKEKVSLNDIEKKVRSARNSIDYLQVNFGTKGEFIKVVFCKDQTYAIAHNIWNMEFWTKLRILCRQYKVTNPTLIAQFITSWVNRLNS